MNWTLDDVRALEVREYSELVTWLTEENEKQRQAHDSGG
jgi:hypothetical protein